MPDFEVDVREVWIQTYRVNDVDDAESAQDIVLAGGGMEIRKDYESTCDEQFDVENGTREVV